MAEEDKDDDDDDDADAKETEEDFLEANDFTDILSRMSSLIMTDPRLGFDL